jgi:hypothetical protein
MFHRSLINLLLKKVYQVNCLCQSASAAEITFKLTEMKIRARKGILFSMKFWLNPNVPLSFLYQIKNFTDQIKAEYFE